MTLNLFTDNMTPAEMPILQRYSISLVRQGRHKFYTLTMPSDILAQCSFVSTREEDPKLGFQRLLNRDRAVQIAEYIDEGLGTIPSAIVLSAQKDANLRDVGNGKTIEFEINPKAFLILDGQHRVFGFSLARSVVRVPVVIYNGLTRTEESKLFIDINTKQRPVPNELLLDIKNLADYESDAETFLRNIFNLFDENPDSPLLGLMSASKKIPGKLNRVTFNNAMKPLFSAFQQREPHEIYEILSEYLKAFVDGLTKMKQDRQIVNPIVFRAIMMFYPEVGQRVKDKFNNYSYDAFCEILTPFFSKVTPAKFANPKNSYKELYEHFSSSFRVYTF